MLIDRFKAFLYFFYLQANCRIQETRRWEKVQSRVPATVYYGHDNIPKPGDKAGGGIVKCQDLQTLYPNTIWGANTLYLVSSALPACPEIMVAYAKRKGVRVIVNQNGVAIPAYHGTRLETINRPRRVLLQHADHVIYQSDYCRISADRYLTREVASWSIMHNPVDTNVFTVRSKKGTGPRLQLLMTGSHGRFYRYKAAIDVLVELNKMGLPADLQVAGRLAWKNSPDECRRQAEEYAKNAGVQEQVTFSGPYSQHEAPEIYRKADIFLHTQYKDACPRVVVEAMACGLPVVYSASGGVPELVGNEAGIGVAVADDWERIQVASPVEMAEALSTVTANYHAMSSHARRRAVEKLDLQRWLAAHEALII